MDYSSSAPHTLQQLSIESFIKVTAGLLYLSAVCTGCQGPDWNQLVTAYTVKYQHEYILTDFLGTVRLRAIVQRPSLHRLPLTH